MINEITLYKEGLKPGDMFTYATGYILWDTATATFGTHIVIERIKAFTDVCMVLARIGDEYLLLPPSKKFGWSSLVPRWVQRL